MNKQYRLLVVDDELSMLMLLETILKKEGFDVQTATSGEEALAKMKINTPNMVITDLFMDGMNGMQLMESIHSKTPLLPVVILSGQAQIRDAVKATHLGSSAFITKPIDRDKLVEQISRILNISANSKKDAGFAADIIYKSNIMDELVELAKAVSATSVTVFISGETGTGKEVFAKAIHEASERSNQPFIGVNCGAIPEQLLESELFGHEKGAFTSAVTRHEGLFRAASGGTLFLDEIGDMPLSLQVKLLRVLQDMEVRPVGSTKPYPIDVRIISATHRDLDGMVEAGEFRADLYYRLKVVPLAIPNLSDRCEDIPLLANYFIEKHAQANNQKKKHLSPDAMDYLLAAEWPGNIRQLNNVIELCATLSKTKTIPLSLVKSGLQDRFRQMKTLKEAKLEFEKNYLIGVLKMSGGHVSNAAKISGRNRTEFYKLLNLHSIEPGKFRSKNKT
ncbi:MAG: sigma-54-dependent Fis family transcriptional regulator [Gammaproteobacteria bacterium]|nr:sigma-54-dependent Fis family transcriptional regulator [Gammaproteobacteria bacterium]